MRKIKDRFLGILVRYAFIILAALPNLFIFYFIFTPLTLWPVFALLNLFFEANVINNIILINNEIPIEIIPACVAGSAYYLLFLLNLSVPNIKVYKRIKMLLFSFGSLLVLNIIRIFVLSIVLFSASESIFDITHKLFWYLVSIILVVGIWFLTIKIFKVKEIPFYSDIKYILGKSILKKKFKKSKSSRKH